MLAQLTVTIDPTMVVIDLVIGVLAAFYAYRAAQRYRVRFGVTPWRWPAGVWSVVFFLSLVIGVVLFLIARATTRPSTAVAEPRWGPATPEVNSARAVDLGQAGPPPATAPPAGWYPDPSARHEQRYWDGKGWTGHVSTAGVRSEEPTGS